MRHTPSKAGPIFYKVEWIEFILSYLTEPVDKHAPKPTDVSR